ncbi:hypothetical protein [Paracidobacterium acidisoli]|uniref:Uncharacterized protein n=1 Tax=Paracidobacterium acidisoli TaxID=2303751 RepID=A0A372IQE8_9BACT|nr:hypothetical protein [Paracidobacterium acidisoli]MBT9331488.1 hypothetical protein [Paracidobacterium acidisoli]
MNEKEQIRIAIRALRDALPALEAKLAKLEAAEAATTRTQDCAIKGRRYAFSARWCEQHKRYETQHAK